MRRETGIELEVITGTEEARLVYEAVKAQAPFGRKKWLLVDLGGGSVEVSLVDHSAILWSESHTMGSVRLLEELAVSGEEPGRFQRLLEEYAATLRIPVIARQWIPASSGPSAWAAASVWAPSSAGRTRTSGSSTATARSPTASRSSTPSRAMESR